MVRITKTHMLRIYIVRLSRLASDAWSYAASRPTDSIAGNDIERIAMRLDDQVIHLRSILDGRRTCDDCGRVIEVPNQQCTVVNDVCDRQYKEEYGKYPETPTIEDV